MKMLLTSHVKNFLSNENNIYILFMQYNIYTIPVFKVLITALKLPRSEIKVSWYSKAATVI